VDEENLEAIAKMISEKIPGAQIIVNSWHPPEGMLPDGWKIEFLGEVKDA